MSRARGALGRAEREPGASGSGAYDVGSAASYWSVARHDPGDELAAVLSLGEPPHVNEAYDSWETGLILDTLADAYEWIQDARGLDLGAGVGRVSVRLAPHVRRLACGDLAPGMLERLSRNAARSGMRNIDPVRLRSDRLPFRDGSVAVAACLGLLEHLPPHPRRATIAELARVLRPGGYLAIVLNNEESVLLRDPEDNPERLGMQRPNGYYCSLVDRSELEEGAARDFGNRTVGSNLFYSLQRHASRMLSDSARRDRRLAPFFQCAALWDRALLPLGPLARAAADHHFHLLIRR